MQYDCVVFQSGEGLNECEQVLSAQGSVTALCVDGGNGAIIAGIQEFIRSYFNVVLDKPFCICNIYLRSL